MQLWPTWLGLTVLYVVLGLLPFDGGPAPLLRLFTPITLRSFTTVRAIVAIPFALLAIEAGERIGERQRYRRMRQLYNWAFLFALTAIVDLLLWSEWVSFTSLLQ